MPTRRHILVCLAAVAAAACGGGSSPVDGWWPDDEGLAQRLTDARPAVMSYFEGAPPNRVARIGTLVLEALPELDDASFEAVVDRALRTIESSTETEAVTDLEAQVQADFDNIDVTDVEGWTLSPTEVGLAALFAIVR